MKLGLILASALAAAPMTTQAQGSNPDIDMEVVKKWSAVNTAHYHAEAAFHGWTKVSKRWAGSEGDVKDSLTADFNWDINKRELIGAVKFANGASSVGAMRSTMKECPAAQIAGIYEHVTVASGGASPSGGVELKGVRQYAPTKSPVECPASNALIATPGDQEDVSVLVIVADPRLLSVGQTGMPNVKVSADKKSYTVEDKSGWTWTVTPTPVN